MLSIGRLASGGQAYYLATVASGVEDYYIGRGEAPGRWLGTLDVDLDLDGRVDGNQLHMVLDGRDPSDGTRLCRTRSDRTPGFDLCFRAPKSVSVLFGLGGHETSREVRAAHDDAVSAALGYLERAACWARRGTNGIDQIRGDGFVAAAFRHRTSRAGDPHLHTHVLVANATRAEDGRWSSLDARHLYLHAKTAGYLYEAHLRDDLTRRLGIAWGPVRNGIADLDGIPDSVLKLFSKRRAEIEAEMTRRGVTSARAAEIATLETRHTKGHQVEPGFMIERWWTEAHALGFEPETLNNVLHRGTHLGPDGEQVRDELADVVYELFGAEGLTAHASSFDRRDVLRAWCDQLAAGAGVATIESLADWTIAQPEVVALQATSTTALHTRSRGRRIEGPDLGGRYSTVELVALEQQVVDHVAARRDRDVGIVHHDVVLDALRTRPELSDEQSAMVVRLTTEGHGVDLVIAPAGTGKTFALDAARDAWQHDGYVVIGATLAARAAAELEATAGIRSGTLASLLADLDESRGGGLPKRAVVIIDEAGMVGTRALARVLAHAEAAEAKVVLVGDPRQLPEIDAGGVLRGLGERFAPIRLTLNRRQHEAWERAALSALRRGYVDHALRAYGEHDRIVNRPSASATRDVMVADWWAARLAGDDVLMVAARWHDVDDLNARARQHIAGGGMLSGPTLDIDGRPYQTGDRVMTLRNQRRLGVRNGTPATITHIDPAERSVTIRTDPGSSHTLPAGYLDAGHLRHAYATTIHKAQGLTVDQALVLGDDTLYREAAYVALSRGRAQNRLYLVAPADESEHHTPERERELVAEIGAALRISHAQQLAIDHGIVSTPVHDRLDQLYDERQRLRVVADAAPADTRADIDALQRSHAQLRGSLHERRVQLAALHKRHPVRHRTQRAAERVRTTQQVERLEDRIDHTESELTRALDQSRARDSYIADHEGDLARLPAVEREIRGLLTRLVDGYRDDPPSYLEQLGPYPADSSTQEHWTHAAQLVEDYRHDHQVTDPHFAFGVPDHADLYQQLAIARLKHTLEQLSPDRSIEPPGMELDW